MRRRAGEEPASLVARLRALRARDSDSTMTRTRRSDDPPPRSGHSPSGACSPLRTPDLRPLRWSSTHHIRPREQPTASTPRFGRPDGRPRVGRRGRRRPGRGNPRRQTARWFSKRAYCLRKSRLALPVGPLRCLATSIWASCPVDRDLVVVLRLAVDEEDHVSVLLERPRLAEVRELGGLSWRDSRSRESWERAMTGTSSSRARIFRPG